MEKKPRLTVGPSTLFCAGSAKTFSLTLILLLAGMCMMPAAARERSSLPDLKDTKITMDWKDFKALVEKGYVPPPAAPVPPAEAFLRSAEYKGDLRPGLLTLDGTLVLQVLKTGWIRFPLWNQGTLVRFDGKGAFLRRNGGRVEVMAKGPGTFTLKAKIVFKAPDHPGENTLSLNLPDAPRNLVNLSVARGIKDLKIPSGLAYAARDDRRFISLKGGAVTLRYSLPFRREVSAGGEEVKLEPRIHVMGYQFLDLGEGVMRGLLLLDYQVRVAKTGHFDIDLKDGIEVFDVSAPGMESWKILKKEGNRYLRVQLGAPAEGSIRVLVNFEGSYDSGKGVLEVPRLEPIGVEREAGFVGVAAEGAEIKWELSGNLLPADASELPPDVSRFAGNLVEVLKFSGKPDKAVVTVTEHEEAPVLTAIIERLNATTVVLDSGTEATWIDLSVRNNRKQFLKMTTPGGEVEIWSLLLDGEPAKPKLSGDKILVPLPRGGGERASRISLVLLRKGTGFPWMGTVSPNLPRFDVPVSEALWSLYMPEGHRYSVSRKNYRPVGRATRFAGLGSLGPSRPSSEPSPKESSFLSKKIVADQMKQEADLQQQLRAKSGASRKGALPVRISIPGGVASLPKLSVSRMLTVVGDDTDLKIRVSPRWVRKVFVLLRVALLLFAGLLVGLFIVGRMEKRYRSGVAGVALLALLPWGGVGFAFSLFILILVGFLSWVGPRAYGALRGLLLRLKIPGVPPRKS